MEAAFQEVAEKATAAGWGQQEIAIGLIGLVEAHICTLRENAKTEAAMSRAEALRPLSRHAAGHISIEGAGGRQSRHAAY